MVFLFSAKIGLSDKGRGQKNAYFHRSSVSGNHFTTFCHNCLSIRRKNVWRVLLICVLFSAITSVLYFCFNGTDEITIIELDNDETKNKIGFAQLTTIDNDDPIPIIEIVANRRYLNYYDDDGLRDEWQFDMTKNYNESTLIGWSAPMVVDRSKFSINNNRCELGTAFKPSDGEKAEMEELIKKHNFNFLASEKISLHRSLPDSRFDACKSLVYPEKLPTTSVIIIFHNEPWTTLLRTIWGVIDRTPRELIEEFVLVDDVSTLDILKRPLEDYIEQFPVPVKLIRTAKREGLIRARLLGAKAAKGSILTFLDAHIEVVEGWYQPLAARISDDRSVVAVPMIDFISCRNFGYKTLDHIFYGLHWDLVFSWIDLPQRERDRVNNDETAPIRVPTHVGCAFSIDREFFWLLGSYDEEFNIWGSENVELAWRAWLCGGAMEVLPCSRLSHLFRTSTYSFDGSKKMIKRRNNARLVEVWMDEFKGLFYAANPGSRVPFGDISNRLELKSKLKCKNFRWYLENIYPESLYFLNFTFMGEIKSVASGKCLDSKGRSNGLAMYACHGKGKNQFFALTSDNSIHIYEERCIGVKIKEGEKYPLRTACKKLDPLQQWYHDKKNNFIVNNATGLCMEDKTSVKRYKKIILSKCDPNNERMQWILNPYSQTNPQ